MLKNFNSFYITVVAVGFALFFLLRANQRKELSFYGFAESKETEINYNYPVVVHQILVTPGQAVKKGDVLMQLFRRPAKEILQDQAFRINELEAEAMIEQQKNRNRLAEVKQEKADKLAALDLQIDHLQKELAFKISLAKNLNAVNTSNATYKPIEDELNQLKNNRQQLLNSYELSLRSLASEMNIATQPLSQQIARLEAEQAFEAAQENQPILVTAPTDGLIGNIYCKEEEHIPSYNTLLSFYEPHSVIIKGYVHEDHTLQIKSGDHFTVFSLKNDAENFSGTVVGLGSRIVEIPVRLRKIPDLKSYGREVLVEIPIDNSFLQNEKVSLHFEAQ